MHHAMLMQAADVSGCQLRHDMISDGEVYHQNNERLSVILTLGNLYPQPIDIIQVVSVHVTCCDKKYFRWQGAHTMW